MQWCTEHIVREKLAFQSAGKALYLEAGTGCSVLALQQFTDHFGRSLIPPGPQFSCLYNGMSSQVPSSLSSPVAGITQGNFLGIQRSLPAETALPEAVSDHQGQGKARFEFRSLPHQDSGARRAIEHSLCLGAFLRGAAPNIQGPAA